MLLNGHNNSDKKYLHMLIIKGKLMSLCLTRSSLRDNDYYQTLFQFKSMTGYNRTIEHSRTFAFAKEIVITNVENALIINV